MIRPAIYGPRTAIRARPDQAHIAETGVARAEKTGAVIRTADRDDQRRVTVQLTPAGHRLATTALEYRLRSLRDATSDWADHERASFADLLTRFTHRKEPS